MAHSPRKLRYWGQAARPNRATDVGALGEATDAPATPERRDNCVVTAVGLGLMNDSLPLATECTRGNRLRKDGCAVSTILLVGVIDQLHHF